MRGGLKKKSAAPKKESCGALLFFFIAVSHSLAQAKITVGEEASSGGGGQVFIGLGNTCVIVTQPSAQ